MQVCTEKTPRYSPPVDEAVNDEGQDDDEQGHPEGDADEFL